MLLLLTLLSFWNEPLWIKPGDAVLDIPVTDLNGQTIQLPELASDTTVCVFVSLSCPACQDAVQPLNTLTDTYELIYLFVESHDKVQKELPRTIHPSQAFTINLEDLKKINAKTLPTVLAYRNDQLVFGYYGPINHDKLPLFRGAIDGTLEKP